MAHIQVALANVPTRQDFPRSPRALPVLFNICIKSDAGEYHESTYGLANRHLGPQKLLIDYNLHVEAMIDLDFVLSGPQHLLASLPCRYHS